MDDVSRASGGNPSELALAGALFGLFVLCAWGVAVAGEIVLPDAMATKLRLDAPPYKSIPVGMVLLMTLGGLTAIVGEAMCRTHSEKHLAIAAVVVGGAATTWAWMAGGLPLPLSGRLLALPAFLVAVVSVGTGLWMFCKTTNKERTMSQRALRLSIRAVGIVAIVAAALAPLDLRIRVAMVIGASGVAVLVDMASGRKAA